MPYRKNKKLIHDTEGNLTHKDCPRCHRLLPVVDFNVNRAMKEGIDSVCRTCIKRIRELRDSTDARRRLMLSRVKSVAKKHNLPFDLTLEDIVIPAHCPVFGIPLEFGAVPSGEGHWRDNSPSLDRIVPEKGYTRGNVIVVSYRVNRIKNDASIDELGAVADFYRSHHLTCCTLGLNVV